MQLISQVFAEKFDFYGHLITIKKVEFLLRIDHNTNRFCKCLGRLCLEPTDENKIWSALPIQKYLRDKWLWGLHEKEWRLRDSNSRPFGPAPEAGALDHSAKSPMLLFCSSRTLITRNYLTITSNKATTNIKTLCLHKYRLTECGDTRNRGYAEKFVCHNLSWLSLLHLDSAWYLAERVNGSVGFASKSTTRDAALRCHRVVSDNHSTMFKEWLDRFGCRRLS